MPSAFEPSTSLHPPRVVPPPHAADFASPGVAGLRRGKSALREYAEAFTVALLLALVIRTFVVQAFKIPSASMYPTLQTGDHILVSKMTYGLRLPLVGTRLVSLGEPQRGDVVVFVYPVDASKDFIKRVVAVAGDVVEIDGKRVLVNGGLWDDPHGYFDGTARTTNGLRDNYGPAVVPPGHVFVMGDNRDRSFDSRFWGFVAVNDIKGKALLIYWSWDGNDDWVRWDRIGEVIQ